MANVSRSSLQGYAGFGFAMGALSPVIHGLAGFALLALICGFLLKACFNLHCTGRALWNGRLLSETDYTPIDKGHPIAWPFGLGCAALLIATLPTKISGLVIDLIIVGEVVFIAAHLLGRWLLLRRFKKVRIARQRQLLGI